MLTVNALDFQDYLSQYFFLWFVMHLLNSYKWPREKKKKKRKSDSSNIRLIKEINKTKNKTPPPQKKTPTTEKRKHRERERKKKKRERFLIGVGSTTKLKEITSPAKQWSLYKLNTTPKKTKVLWKKASNTLEMYVRTK